MTEFKQLPDGIYFNLPFKDYAAQDRFSVSRINKVNESPLTYWTDEIEPTLAEDFDLGAHLDEATESMAEGKAWHVMALEGEDAFNALYATDYNASDFPDALGSKPEHMAAAVKYGVAINKSDTIAKIADKLKMAGAPVTFHDDLRAAHVAANDGKELISVVKMDELRRAGKIMAAYNVQEDFLTGGFPEVSILVTIKGVKYKVRVDYLRPDAQIEFKTITRRSKTKPFDEACADQMHNFGYFTGGYLYSLCVEAARNKLKGVFDGVGFTEGGDILWPKDFDIVDCAGDGMLSVPHLRLIKEFSGLDVGQYWHLFQERGKHNHVLLRRFDKYDEALQSRKVQKIWRTGQVDVERGVKLYNYFMEQNGRENMWLPALDAKPWDDGDFKPWQIEE